MKRTWESARRLLPLGVVVLLGACGGDRSAPDAAQEGDEPQRGGTVVLAELADISLPVTPFFQTALDGNLAADVMNMELVRGVWRDGAVVYETADRHPLALARRYELIGPDSATLRFHMRSDARWSDGRPVTAHDIVYTYGIIKDPKLASPRQDYVEHLDSVTAQSDSTVTFHFRRRYPEMLTHTGLAPLPRHLFQGTPVERLRSHPAILDPTQGKLVVSGPWMIGSWQKGQSVTLVPNPHFRPQPHLAQIVIRVVPEATTRLVELQTGAVDFVQTVSFDQLPNLQAQAPHLRFEREEKRFYDFIAYNPKTVPAFADPEIRRALGLALDVPRMLAALQMQEYAVPGGGPYSPIFKQVYDERQTPALPHDPERAKQILEAKGWRDADGDGIREKDGKPFRFTLLTNAGNQRRADASQIIQNAWRQIGVDAQLQQQEFNTFLHETLIGKKYEAALGGWGVPLTHDLSQLWDPESPQNVTGYQHPQVTAHMRQALSQPTQQAAIPHWKAAAAQIARDQPYTWLYYMDAVDGVNQRVRNMRINTYGPYQNAWEWWVPQRQQQGGAQGSD